MLRTFDLSNCFYFIFDFMFHSDLNISQNCLILWVKVQYLHFTCNVIHEIYHADKTIILWVFLLILILNQSYHETHKAD